MLDFRNIIEENIPKLNLEFELPMAGSYFFLFGSFDDANRLDDELTR